MDQSMLNSSQWTNTQNNASDISHVFISLFIFLTKWEEAGLGSKAPGYFRILEPVQNAKGNVTIVLLLDQDF